VLVLSTTHLIKPERWQKLEELFHAALEHEPSTRAPFLDEACAGDESLREPPSELSSI
jgi:serine/threonine-protein kinase